MLYKYNSWTLRQHYNQLKKRCKRVTDGDAKKNDYKYWKRVVLNTYFGKNLSDEDRKNPFIKKVKKWLVVFIPRIKEEKVTEEDKSIIREVFLPFMEKTEKYAKLKNLEQLEAMG